MDTSDVTIDVNFVFQLWVRITLKVPVEHTVPNCEKFTEDLKSLFGQWKNLHFVPGSITADFFADPKAAHTGFLQLCSNNLIFQHLGCRLNKGTLLLTQSAQSPNLTRRSFKSQGELQKIITSTSLKNLLAPEGPPKPFEKEEELLHQRLEYMKDLRPG